MSLLKFQSFLADYSNAVSRASAFDSKITSDAASVSSAPYGDLLALAARQTFAAIEITISRTSSGDFNTSDLLVFMKEISSSG